MKKAISTITLALTLATVTLVLATSAGAASTRTRSRAWLPDVWWRLATCETGANWQHDSEQGGADQGAPPNFTVASGGHNRTYWGRRVSDYLQWYSSAIGP